MRWISAIAAVLVCAACHSRPDATELAAMPAEPQLSEPACHDFTAPVTAGGRPEQARGQACEQPDGSWQVVQNTPGLPAQAYTLEQPGQPAAAANAGQPAAAANAAPPPQPDHPPCSSYTAPVTVGGQPRQAIIEACPQPDGSWKITQNTPGLPTQVYQVPPPAASPYPYTYPYPIDYAYPDFFPYWLGSPWFFGLGPSIVVVQRFHHFNHGFGHGFGHGFARGFGPGFGHSFAAGHGGGGGGGRH
jgi:surface antigen